MDAVTSPDVTLAENERKAADAEYRRLHAAIDEARATTERANAVAETVKTLNDPESIGRARVKAVLLDEEASAQWSDIARFIAGQKRSMDEGTKDQRAALAEALEQHEAELREHGVVVDIGTEHHVATLASAPWAYVVETEALLPDDVFTRRPDLNKISKRFREKGSCPGAKRKKGKRYVKIGLRGDTTPRRGNGRNEAGEAGNGPGDRD